MAWKRFFRRNYWDGERARELEAYLDLETQENIARGMTPVEASYAARKKLGNLTQIREEIYTMNSIGFLEILWQDLRYGFKALAKNPGFTAVAVLTLGLGIGVNTTVFTAFNAIALKPLPVKDPDSLVRLEQWFEHGGRGDIQYAFSYPEYLYFRDHNRAFSNLIAVSWPVLVLDSSPSGELRNLAGQLVSQDYFTGFGVGAVLGRTFLSEEQQVSGAHPVIVLSYPFWQRRFNSDPQVLGKNTEVE